MLTETALKTTDDPHLEILTVGEMSAADRLSVDAGISLERLMENAGSAVARHVSVRLRRHSRVLVLCGPGNNGGDGYMAARLLANAGHEVQVASLVPRAQLKGEAAAAAARWAGPVVEARQASFEGFDLVVDALFGAGLSRSLDGAAADLVTRANASGRPIVAVDVPSGVAGDSGQVLGTAVEAASTITFFRRKPAHVLLPGRLLCGAVEVADIGIADTVLAEIGPKACLNAPAFWLGAYPRPGIAGHKYSRGHAVVVSGAMPTIGAARLAARGALRIGAGLVTVASPADAVLAHATQLTSIMLRAADGVEGVGDVLSDPRKNAVVMGPGLGVGEATGDLVRAALRPPAGGERRHVVLDADALTSFAGQSRDLAELIEAASGSVVLTPHDGEFAKLFGDEVRFRDPSKLVRARAGAAAAGAVLILKGDDTVVATPNGRVALAEANAPWLATAGAGDVLAGLVGGLLAQGMPAFEAAAAAVWIHAGAARRFGPGLISEDLPDLVPAVLRELLET